MRTQLIYGKIIIIIINFNKSYHGKESKNATHHFPGQVPVHVLEEDGPPELQVLGHVL